MKSNRGITLISLTIYIIGLVIIIGIMDILTTHFMQNTKQITIIDSAQEQYSRFISYITKDANSDNLLYANSGIDGRGEYIILKFDNQEEHQYIHNNESIYYVELKNDEINKKILLCKDVSNVLFKYSNLTDVTNIRFNINNDIFKNDIKLKFGN